MIDFKLIDDSEELNLQLLDDNEEIKLEMTDYDDTEVKEMIDEVDNKVDNLSTQVNHDINEIEADIDELDGRIRINTNNISNLQQTKADKTQVNALSTQVQANTTQIGQNKANITALDNRVDQIPIVTKTSQLTNDSGFITKNVNNLTYYTTTANLARVALTGNYNDLTNKPDLSSFATTTELGNETTARENADIGLQGQIDAITSSSDVKDIVGTYTELQNYDTSTLGNDDIIKVLQDSTHNEAMTYYRWVISGSSGSWQYVGQEGPYYTKSETETLLNNKQNEITSSNKLNSDLVNDENQTNKFVTASNITTWNGKYTKPNDGIPKTDLASDVQTSLGKADTAIQSSDLTNYVTNTDYASSSTAGVIKLNASGYGTSVDSSGALRALVKNYEQYESSNSNYIIGKGTLENVITGKGLIDSSSDITGNASTSTTLKAFNYSRKGTNYTWAKVATASLVGAWEEKHAYLFVKGTHNSNFKQNGIISIDVVGNGTKAKVNSYSAQFISASTDLNVENFYIEYQDGDANTNATINFWVKNTTNTYASWQFKILQNTGWIIESADTSVTTLPTQDFTGKNAELNNISLKAINDKDGNDISTTYVKNTDYATQTTDGLMSSTDKTKLDGIQTGATKNLIFYGSCATGASSSAKVVVCEDFTASDLVAGTRLVVHFTNGNSYNGQATLNVNSTGAKNIYYNGTTTNARYMWVAGESVEFIYNGTQWATINGGLATTSYYGVTKLATGANSDSQAYALTPRSLYYFANYSICPYYSASKTYAVGDKVRYTYYIYECTTAIDTPESWNAEHWQQADTIQEQIDNVYTYIDSLNGNGVSY